MMVSIREAGADDASFLAWVMLAASRSHLTYGLWDHFVGGSEEACLTFLRTISLSRMPHLFHYTVFLIAEQDGQPVAALSGYDPSVLGMTAFGRALPEIFEKLGWSKADQKAAFDRNKPFWSCVPDESPDTWIIESVAAIPTVRRHGIVSMLLQAVIAKGQAKGFSKAQIGVFIGNTPARKAYEKAGFLYVDDKQTPEFKATYGDDGIARLVLDYEK